MAQGKAVRQVLAEQPEQYDPRKYLGPGRDAIKETVIGKMREFGSSQKHNYLRTGSRYIVAVSFST